MIPLKLLPMPGTRKDNYGKPLLDNDGNEIPLIEPEKQQRIVRQQDNMLVGYVCFNPNPIPTSGGKFLAPHTHVSLLLPPSQCPAGFRNHVEEFVKSACPDAPEVKTTQVPEFTPEEVQRALLDEDDDE